MRNLTGEDELTTFSYNATARADGTAHGQYQYNFRAALLSFMAPSLASASPATPDG
jgi:hypothetical protein